MVLKEKHLRIGCLSTPGWFWKDKRRICWDKLAADLSGVMIAQIGDLERPFVFCST